MKIKARELLEKLRLSAGRCSCGRQLYVKRDGEGNQIGLTHWTPEDDDHHNAYFASIGIILPNDDSY